MRGRNRWDRKAPKWQMTPLMNSDRHTPNSRMTAILVSVLSSLQQWKRPWTAPKWPRRQGHARMGSAHIQTSEVELIATGLCPLPSCLRCAPVPEAAYAAVDDMPPPRCLVASCLLLLSLALCVWRGLVGWLAQNDRSKEERRR